jgi:ribulose-phosphate 3-epimerase
LEARRTNQRIARDSGKNAAMSPIARLNRLRAELPAILPSMLLCNFGNLEREIAQLEMAGVTGLHLDVMDGHFVPNLTYGMPIVEAIRKLTKVAVDVHLMIADPGRYVRQFVDAGADIVTIHVEAVNDPAAILREIRDLGVGAVIALNPNTPLYALEECYDQCDLVLVMSVPAGFGGQSFRTVALEKLRQVRARAGAHVLVEVDGGINEQTIQNCAAAGAQLFVVGSAIFRATNYEHALQDLHSRTVRP